MPGAGRGEDSLYSRLRPKTSRSLKSLLWCWRGRVQPFTLDRCFAKRSEHSKRRWVDENTYTSTLRRRSGRLFIEREMSLMKKRAAFFFTRTSLGARSVQKEYATCILTALTHVLSDAPVLIASAMTVDLSFCLVDLMTHLVVLFPEYLCTVNLQRFVVKNS